MSASEVRVRRIAGAPLVDALLAGDPAVLALYGGAAPDRLDTYRERLGLLQQRFDRPARERAAAALRPTSEAARSRLERFVREGGAVVTTGQQAGLFTGPLYTIAKALTAVRLAEALEQALGAVVLPVFWVASEDHDFAEVSRTWAVDGTGGLRRFAISPTAAAPLSMSEMQLSDDVERNLGEYLDVVASDEDERRLLSRCLDGYRAGRTVAQAFGDALDGLLGAFDVCLTDAADPALKTASSDVLAAAARGAAEHEARLRERTDRLHALGFDPPVELVADATLLFFHGRGGRERLERQGGELIARGDGKRFSADEAAAVITAEPGRFSPNVLLRPVVEAAVFPTLAYVGGPAEVSYFAQVAPLFDSFGLPPTPAFPRHQVQIVPAAAAEALAALDLEEAELSDPEHVILERLARAALPSEVEGALDALREAVVRGFGGVVRASESLDATLAVSIGARRNRALLEVAAAERRILRQLKRGDRSLALQLRLVRSHLRPFGVPQERVLPIFQYLGADPGLLTRIADAIRIELRA